MIGPNENTGDTQLPGFGALALMRSLERQLASGQGGSLGEAQEFFYDAMEADSEEAEMALLQRALKLDPGNVDVLLAILRHMALPLEDEIELLDKIVALAEQRLGPKAFKEYAGHFWGFIETRPYMRARQAYADLLAMAGRLDEAIAEFEAMLELNPNDNQGLRYSLMTFYLQANQMEGAARLFSQYDECEFNTVFAWGRVLERFVNRDTEGAKQALTVARKQNGYMEAYVKGHKRPPRHLPEAYAPGSKDEAACFADTLQMAWNAHPKALKWLKEQSVSRRGRGK